MNPNRSRWWFRLAIVLLVGLLALFWAVSQNTRTLKIENRSEQSIPELKITVGGQSQTFKNVARGGQVTVPCPAGGDDHFTVDGRLADDSRIRANGPIREGLDFLLLPDGSLLPRPKSSR